MIRSNLYWGGEPFNVYNVAWVGDVFIVNHHCCVDGLHAYRLEAFRDFKAFDLGNAFGDRQLYTRGDRALIGPRVTAVNQLHPSTEPVNGWHLTRPELIEYCPFNGEPSLHLRLVTNNGNGSMNPWSHKKSEKLCSVRGDVVAAQTYSGGHIIVDGYPKNVRAKCRHYYENNRVTKGMFSIHKDGAFKTYENPEDVRAVSLSPDGSIVAVVGPETVTFWDVD